MKFPLTHWERDLRQEYSWNFHTLTVDGLNPLRHTIEMFRDLMHGQFQCLLGDEAKLDVSQSMCHGLASMQEFLDDRTLRVLSLAKGSRASYDGLILLSAFILSVTTKRVDQKLMRRVIDYHMLRFDRRIV